MSWYGTHPRYSKKEIASLLPPATCKNCIYWFRTVVGSTPDSWYQQYETCPRCGIAQWDILAQLNERLLGISTQHHRRKHETITAPKTPHLQTSGNSGLDKWLTLYGSANIDIRIRAATALIARSDVPLTILLDILDTLSHHGLGASTEKTLLKRTDVDLLSAMIARLDSPDHFVREVACNVLGRSGDSTATRHLLRMIDDPQMMVRRAAGFALSRLKDPSAIPELTRQFAARRNDDTNVVWALRTALETLGVSTDNAK